MKKWMVCVIALATLFSPALRAQDLSGNWQGTLHAGGKDLRIIVNIFKGDKDGWSGKMYSIDQTPQPFSTSVIKVDGSALSFKVDLIGGSYEGKISPGPQDDHRNLDTGDAAISTDSGDGDAGDGMGYSERLRRRRSRWQRMLILCI